MPSACIHSITERFRFYKNLGEAALQQIPDNQLHWKFNDSSNSAGVIVKHISGNMISRFTDFLTTDGEKPWRNREHEFEGEGSLRSDLMRRWEEGWQCLFDHIQPLSETDLERIVYIRDEPHTIIEALNRQLGHYAYHIGQLVYLGKMICGDEWRSLSIPKGQSEAYNRKKFGKD